MGARQNHVLLVLSVRIWSVQQLAAASAEGMVFVVDSQTRLMGVVGGEVGDYLETGSADNW